MMPLHIVQLAVIALSLSAAPQGDAPACSARAEEPRRMELPDGRTVSVDVRSLATSGGLVMALGHFAYVFPRGANPMTSPTMTDSIMGVVVDTSGRVTLVPNPLPRPVLFPKVAAGRNGSFHALFVTGEDSIDIHPVQDTATVWYARFERGRWTQPEVVWRTRHSRLQSDGASALLERNGDLTFLFPVGDPDHFYNGGIVRLRRVGSSWLADTLRTGPMPNAVRATVAPDGRSLVVVFANSAPAGRTSAAEELYLTRFDSTWQAPRRIAGDGVLQTTLPVLVTLDDDIVASWISWRWMDSRTSRIEWLRIAGDSTIAGGILAFGENTFPFEMIGIERRYPLWLFRGEHSGVSAALFIGSGATARRLGTLTIPFDNPRPATIAVSPSRFLVFTQKRGKTDHEPMAASYTTILEIRCPRPARR